MPSLCDHLEDLARQATSQSYGAMARDLGMRIGPLTAALEVLMEEDHAAGLPLRAALCAARLGNGLPALGFFEKAAALGYDVSDPEAFTAGQRQALYARAAASP